MKLGTARYARDCPVCQKRILAGDELACLGGVGSFAWVHVSCFIPWRLRRETERLDAEFRRVVAGR